MSMIPLFSPRVAIRSTLLASLPGLMAGPVVTMALSAPRPNIVVIFADDLGYGDVLAYNPGAKTRTPNIDRLASAGMLFTDGHACSSVCTPSRYGLLTGRYSWRTSLKEGVLRSWAPLLIEQNCDTLASLLKRNGYQTAVVGKWHLGLGLGNDMQTKFSSAPEGLRPGPNERGFDYSYIIPASANMSPMCYLKDLQPVNGVDGSISPPFNRWRITTGNGAYPLPMGFDRGPVAPGIDLAYDANPASTPRYNKVMPRLTDEAAAYISSRSTGQPFFLYFALPSPHTPWVPDIETTGKSDEEIYIAFVNATDAAVGRIVDALERSGQLENTLIFFSSDNGPELRHFQIDQAGHSPAGRFRGEKSDLYEGGHRVPFIMTWPGHIRPGSTSDQLICTLDLYKTFATLLGDHRPAGMIGGEDSCDFSSLLLGQSSVRPLRPSLVSQSSHGRFGMRIGDWKYLDWPGSGGYLVPNTNTEGTPGQLFNLRDDPAEKRNLYREHPDRVATMKAAMLEIQGKDAPAKTKE